MTTKLITNQYKLHLAEQMMESVSEVANTIYYVFVSNHIPVDDDQVPEIETSYNKTVLDVYKKMIFGKRVTPLDVKLLIRNIPYVSNTVYAKYDDADTLLSTKDFYAIVNESSYYHVYKCLDNNGNVASTAQPTFADVQGSNISVYQTSDGYRWKYMYSVSSSDKNKFASSEYFPVISNNDVINSAVDGSIDIISVDFAGSGYDNYLNGIFKATDIRINGDDLVYSISNDSINMSNGFYNNCVIYISGGIGQGQHRKITEYYTTNTGNYITLDRKFETIPTNLSEYQINPNVRIDSDGNHTSLCVARALVNASSSNSIYRIEIIDRGSGYKFANAVIEANSIVGITNPAILRPIFSPYGGHGYNTSAELESSRVCMSITFMGNESNLLPFGNEYKQIGVIRNPLFANVKFEMANQSSSFVTNETIYKVDPVFMLDGVTANQFTTNISFSNGNFTSRFSDNDRILLYSSNSYQLVNISSVVNSSLITLSSNSLITSNNVAVYIANTTASGKVKDVLDGSSFLASHVTGDFENGDTIIGATSGTYGTINLLSRNDVYKNFTTFIQAYKYVGNSFSGTIEENELLTQVHPISNISANAYVHSSYYTGSNVMVYVTDVKGEFFVDNNTVMTGNTSDASFLPFKLYTPEIMMNSGEIIFLENIDAVTRDAAQKETLKIIYEF